MELGPDLQVAPTQCPTCGQMLDGAMSTSGDSEPPKPGDVGMCIFCLAWHEWVQPDLARYVRLRHVPDMVESREQVNGIVKMVIAACEAHADGVREKRIIVTRAKEAKAP